MKKATKNGFTIGMCIALLLSVLAISPIMAQEENQFSVSVLSSSGRPISGVQVYLANRDGIFHRGTADSDGLFVFEKPRHGQWYLLLAAPFHESKALAFGGRSTVSVTLTASESKSSSIGEGYVVALGNKGTVRAYGKNMLSPTGISFGGGDAPFSVGRTINAIDSSGNKFRLWVKEAFPPVYVIEYTP